MMNYFEFMERIEKLSKKESFSRDDMLDIIDYISINIGFVTDITDCGFIDHDVLLSKLKSFLDDLMIRFGPRSSDE